MEKQEPKFGSKVQCKSRIPSNGPRSLWTTMVEDYFGKFEDQMG